MFSSPLWYKQTRTNGVSSKSSHAYKNEKMPNYFWKADSVSRPVESKVQVDVLAARIFYSYQAQNGDWSKWLFAEELSHWTKHHAILLLSIYTKTKTTLYIVATEAFFPYIIQSKQGLENKH